MPVPLCRRLRSRRGPRFWFRLLKTNAPDCRYIIAFDRMQLCDGGHAWLWRGSPIGAAPRIIGKQRKQIDGNADDEETQRKHLYNRKRERVFPQNNAAVTSGFVNK